MPFVKIHVSSVIKHDISVLLVRDIRTTLVDVLQIEETIGQVMLYQTPVEYRSAHLSRDINFVFIEIIMYPGRSTEIKKKLIERVIFLVHTYLGIDGRDINCCIIEVASENWGGGVSHRYINELSE